MPAWLKGLLIAVISAVIAPIGLLLYDKTLLKLLARHPGGIEGVALTLIRFFEGGSLLLISGSALAVGAAFGLIYGVMSGILLIYDLSSPAGWLEMVIDLTWSLPNTLFGFVAGNIIYPFFGTPSQDKSENQGWIVYAPRGSRFGNGIKQTLGTVNLGGPGNHERVHLMQARLFGPAFLILFGANYIVNFAVQAIWSGTIGLVLWLTNVCDHPYLPPLKNSVIKGYFGWIYSCTVFEAWAYGTE